MISYYFSLLLPFGFHFLLKFFKFLVVSFDQRQRQGDHLPITAVSKTDLT